MNGRALHILCVEDHADTAEVLSRMLRMHGHRVTTANTLAAALELATLHAFDALVADVALPDGSGLELVRAVRRAHPLTRCIATSGLGMAQDVARGRDAGFDHYLVKPIVLEQVLVALASSFPAPSHTPAPAPDLQATT